MIHNAINQKGLDVAILIAEFDGFFGLLSLDWGCKRCGGVAGIGRSASR